MSGIGMYACMGRWAKPSFIFVKGSHVRIVLGWFCVCFMVHDTDMILGVALRAAESARTARFAEGGMVEDRP